MARAVLPTGNPQCVIVRGQKNSFVVVANPDRYSRQNAPSNQELGRSVDSQEGRVESHSPQLPEEQKRAKHVALLRQNQRSQLVEDVLGAERVTRDYVYFATRIKLLDFANEHAFQNKIAQARVSRDKHPP